MPRSHRVVGIDAVRDTRPHRVPRLHVPMNKCLHRANDRSEFSTQMHVAACEITIHLASAVNRYLWIRLVDTTGWVLARIAV